MINSLHGHGANSSNLSPVIPKHSSQNSGSSITNSSNHKLYPVEGSQLMIVNNQITQSVERIVAFIYKLHTQAQQNEQTLQNFELKLSDQNINEQLSQLVDDCKKGLLEVEDVGTGNYSLILGYHLSMNILASVSSFPNYVSQFHEMNQLCSELFLKLGPSLDLLIPEIREKSQEFYKINDALDLSWGFAEIKDSILQLANMQDHLHGTLIKRLQPIVEYGNLLDSGLEKLQAESNTFYVRDTHQLFAQRAKELNEQISFLTHHSKSIHEGLAIYADILNFLVNCQLQLHTLCDSIAELETYYPLLVQSQLSEAGY